MSCLDLNNLNIEQVKELNQIARQLIPEFNTLSGEILSSNGNTLAWMLHPLVSRNPYHSSLFIQLCYLSLAKRYVDSGKCSEGLTVQNQIQRAILNDYIKSAGLECKIPKAKYIYNIHNRLYGVFSVISRSILYLNSRVKARIFHLSSKGPIILLDTFILKNTLKAGHYIDRYYPNILDSLPPSYVSRVFWVPTILGGFSRHQVHDVWINSRENILYKQDLLELQDYFKAFSLLLGTTFNRNHTYLFQGMNISRLVNHEYRTGRISKSAFEGLLNFYFVKRLRSKNIQLDLVIDWNENQAIDKGLIKGVKTFYPGVYSKGYQGYIISTDYNFYIQPTEYEVLNGVIPDEICVIGKSLESRIKENISSIKVTTSPAYRFQNVYREYPVMKNRIDNILVVLPIGLSESYDVITVLSSAFNDQQIEQYPVFIKAHPTMNIDKLKKICGHQWLSSFKIIEGDFNEIVSNANLVIGSASSTLMETIVRGIPVIVVGNQKGLTQNPIPETVDQDLWSLCYTSQGIANSIATFMGRPEKLDKDYKQYANSLRANYFQPVDNRSLNLLEQVGKN